MLTIIQTMSSDLFKAAFGKKSSPSVAALIRLRVAVGEHLNMFVTLCLPAFLHHEVPEQTVCFGIVFWHRASTHMGVSRLSVSQTQC